MLQMDKDGKIVGERKQHLDMPRADLATMMHNGREMQKGLDLKTASRATHPHLFADEKTAHQSNPSQSFVQQQTRKLLGETEQAILQNEQEQDSLPTRQEVQRRSSVVKSLKDKFVLKQEDKVGGVNHITHPDNDNIERIIDKFTPKALSGLKKYRGDSSEMHPITVVSILTNNYDADWPDWLPETLFETIKQDNLFSLENDTIANTVMACQTLYSHQGFWDDWETFMPMVEAFNGRLEHPTLIKPLTQGEMIFAKRVADVACTDMDLSDDILKYAAASTLYYGGLCGYMALEDAQPHLNTILVGKPDYNKLDEYRQFFDDLYSMKYKEYKDFIVGREPAEDSVDGAEMTRIVATVTYLKEKEHLLLEQLG